MNLLEGRREMAVLRAASLRMESGIWLFTNHFGVTLAFGFSSTGNDAEYLHFVKEKLESIFIPKGKGKA